MTLTDARRFQIGDRVRVRDRAAVWTVTGDDTGQTPVRDPEPAYRLTHMKASQPTSRYVYESEIQLATPADTR